jgi:hypothetical protein
MRPHPVEPVDVGGGQHLAAEPLAPRRAGALGVGPKELREQRVGAVAVGHPRPHRALDRGQRRQPSGQHPLADHQGVAVGQREQHLEPRGGRL